MSSSRVTVGHSSEAAQSSAELGFLSHVFVANWELQTLLLPGIES